MADKYLSWSDVLKAKEEIEATVTSTGAAEAGDIIALDSNGLIDPTLLPTTGTLVFPASENLAANDLVNKHDDTGTASVRKADHTSRQVAHGFVKSAVTSPANATVFTEGLVGGQTFLAADVGKPVFLGTNGGITLDCTAPGSGQSLQQVGCVVSTTQFNFEPGEEIVRA